MRWSTAFPYLAAKRPEGFVLIAVLLLVALVTILVVTTSMLARVERSAVNNSANTELARQNALFGLNVALAQLQRDLGPDRSVSARADIFDTNVGPNFSATAGVTGVANPYWTGAWQSYNPTSGAVQSLDVNASGGASSTGSPVLRNWSTGTTTGSGTTPTRPNAFCANMDWLVSGALADHATANATTSPLSLSATNWQPVFASSGTANLRNAVVLAKNFPDLSQPLASQSASSPVNVAAPLVALQPQGAAVTNGSAIGQYAYWVSDEGVKAKVNIVDQALNPTTTSATLSQLHFLTSQSVPSYVPPSATPPGLLNTNTTDIRLDASLAKVSSLQSLSFTTVSNSTSFTGAGATQFAPDVTTYSMGVLSDTQNGGLKRDLTAAFEDPTFQQYNNLLNSCSLGNTPDIDAQSVFRATGAIPAQSSGLMAPAYLDGLRWRSLLFYYDLYKPSNGKPPYYSAAPSGPAPSGTSTTYPANITGNEVFPYVIDMRYPSTSSSSPPNTGQGYGLDYMLPVILAVQLDVTLSAVPDTATSGQTNDFLQLEYRPSIVYYNPYSVRLNANSVALGTSATFSMNTNMLSSTTLTYTVTSPAGATVAGPTTAYVPGGNPATGTQNDTTFTVDPSSLTYMDPGEVRVFGLDTTTPNAGTVPFSSGPALGNLKSNTSVSQDNYVAYQIPATGTPTSFPKTDIVNMNVSNSMSANRVSQSANNVNGWPDQKASSGRYNNGGLPGASNIPGTWTNQPVSYFENNPIRLIGYYARTKGLVSSLPAPQASAAYKYQDQQYDLPMFYGNNLKFLPTDDSSSNSWMELYVERYVPYLAGAADIASFPVNGYEDTYWGAASVGVISAPTAKGATSQSPQRLILNDIPTQPMVSLGQYMHLEPRYYYTSGAWGHQQWPAMAFGGSFPSPDVSQLNTNDYASSSQLYYDFSFMANQALFDSYFFSTVPATTNQYTDPALPYGGTKFTTTYVQNRGTLANGRMKYYFKNGTAPTTLTALQGCRTAADNLLVDGAFNINSTSVKAWKALLSSLSGNSLTVWDPVASQKQTLSSSTLVNPIPRFLSTIGGAAVNQPWSGMRALTDAQVTDLATQIVQQVKIRGPFLNMADFLNRRLAGTISENTMGALQNAIEINALETGSTNINSATRALGMTPSPSPTPNYLPPNTAVGIPGDLMQQDLVQAFAPVMTARTDTFVIRCYGEANNPKSLDSYGYSKPQARAWGEAVVQRLPDYVDQTDPALYSTNSPALQPLGDSTPVSAVNAANSKLGRRIKVLSFHWLNESDL